MTSAEVGAALQARRKQLGLRQQDVADLCGVSRRLVVELEAGRGQRDPGLAKVLQVCSVLGLELVVVPATVPGQR